VSKKTVLRTATAFILATAALTGSMSSASAAAAPVSHPRIEVHFDLAAGQQPENLVIDPDGSVDLVFARSHEIAKITRDGRTHVLATLPAPADGFAIAAGLVKAPDGTFYVGYAAGSNDLTGIWRIRPGGTPKRVIALSANSFPNGLDLDRNTGELYIADSALGTIWRAPVTGGQPTAWSTAPELAKTSLCGVNGLKLHNGAVWASNWDTGTLVRIPVGRGGQAGRVETRFTGMPGIDDFAFLGDGDTVFAANNGTNQVLLIKPDGTHSVVLTAEDGLEGPTAIGIRGNTLYVPSAAYTTQKDPNLLVAHLDQRH
jgi:sugar lactone lactonase YvrE